MSVILLWRGNPTLQGSSPCWKALGRERNGGGAPRPGARSYESVIRSRSGEPVKRGSSDPVRSFAARSPRSRCLPPRVPARGSTTGYSQVRVTGFQRSALASSRRTGSTNSETGKVGTALGDAYRRTRSSERVCGRPSRKRSRRRPSYTSRGGARPPALSRSAGRSFAPSACAPYRVVSIQSATGSANGSTSRGQATP